MQKSLLVMELILAALRNIEPFAARIASIKVKRNEPKNHSTQSFPKQHYSFNRIHFNFKKMPNKFVFLLLALAIFVATIDAHHHHKVFLGAHSLAANRFLENYFTNRWCRKNWSC